MTTKVEEMEGARKLFRQQWWSSLFILITSNLDHDPLFYFSFCLRVFLSVMPGQCGAFTFFVVSWSMLCGQWRAGGLRRASIIVRSSHYIDKFPCTLNINDIISLFMQIWNRHSQPTHWPPPTNVYTWSPYPPPADPRAPDVVVPCVARHARIDKT